MRSVLDVAVAMLVVFAAAGCGTDPYGGPGGVLPSASPSSAAPLDVVSVTGFVFEPARMTVEQGATLRYVNGDRAAHTVTQGVDGKAAPGAAFDVELGIEATATVTFASPGEIRVTCRFHPAMNQVVAVAPAGGSVLVPSSASPLSPVATTPPPGRSSGPVPSLPPGYED